MKPTRPMSYPTVWSWTLDILKELEKKLSSKLDSLHKKKIKTHLKQNPGTHRANALDKASNNCKYGWRASSGIATS